MSGDYSRLSSRRWPIYEGTLLQQGRPLTDRDWNDLVAQLNRRDQAGTLDASGKVLVSNPLPDAFKIEFDSGDLVINRGRLYVDGLLADNRGAGDLKWDPMLTEQFGKDRVRYTKQRYFPNAPPLPTSGGPYLVFLDVWQREVTQFEDGDIVESALGVDSTTRLQTVWQVKVQVPPVPPGGGTGATCGSPVELKSSSGRLTTSTGIVPGDVDPCLVPPSGGYKGLENQLYRVEIHKEGPLGIATFKWSRDNASVTARVSRLIDPSNIVVESVGKDDVLRFSDGDWIEITDDWLELNGQAGVLRKIEGPVVDATRTITLDTALTPEQLNLFPTDAQGKPDPNRHTRIRRWDQKGKVFDDSGAVFVPAIDNDGIPVPSGDKKLLIEDGVLVSFSIDPDSVVGDGKFHVGDYWAFYARVNDASIELLDKEPPRGIHHHYANLALFTPTPVTVEDCRPKPEAEHGDCCCTVVVAPKAGATSDIQDAITSLPLAGGCVCLKPGVHRINDTIRITRGNVKLVGESPGAIVQMEAAPVALSIGPEVPSAPAVMGVEISTIEFTRSTDSPQLPIVAFVNTAFSTIEDCAVRGASQTGIFIDRGWYVCVARCRIGQLSTGIELGSSCDSCIIEANVVGEVLNGIVVRGLPHDVIVTKNFVECFPPTTDLGFVGIHVEANSSIVSQNIVKLQNTNERQQIGIHVIGRDLKVIDNEIRRVPPPERNHKYPIGIQIGVDATAVVGSNRIQGPARVTRLSVSGSPHALRVRAAGNTIVDCPTGIYTTHASNVIIESNVIQSNAIEAPGNITDATVGIRCDSGARTRITANSMANGGIGVLVHNESEPMVSHNRIYNMAYVGVDCGVVKGRCDIVGNRIKSCGFGFVEQFEGVGILVEGIDGELHVEANEVIDTGLSEDGIRKANSACGVRGDSIKGARVESNLITYSDFTSPPQALALMMSGISEPAPAAIQILNNRFVGHGGSVNRPLVKLTHGDCVVTSNSCLLSGPASLPSGTPIVHIYAATAVVGSNRIQGPNGVTPLLVEVTEATIFGNIVSGDIKRGVQTLQPPWAQMNIKVPGN